MLDNLTGVQLATLVVSIIISLAIHEAMHGYVAHWLGDSTAADAGRLTLNPLKHIDLFTTILLPLVMIVVFHVPFFAAKPVPFNPYRVKFEEYGAALIGIAGPLTNLVLAGIAAILFRTWGIHASSFVYNTIIIFTEVNVGFFVFNMIPVPPLDGSRLLYAFAPEPLQKVMRQIETFGLLAVLVLVLVLFQFISGPIINIENHILNFLLG